MSETAEAGYVVTLVHGSFARGAPWTREASDFRDTLVATLGRPCVFRPFEWSGRNRPGWRLRAAEALREHLERGLGEHPSAKHYVVCHSHGGNVLLYALRGQPLQDRLNGLVCLSTPFLHVRLRRLGDHAHLRRVVSQGGAFAVTLAALHRLPIAGALAAGAAAWLLLHFYQALLARKVWDYARDLVLPADLRTPLLIVRSAGDEVAGISMATTLSGFAARGFAAAGHLRSLRAAPLLAVLTLALVTLASREPSLFPWWLPPVARPLGFLLTGFIIAVSLVPMALASLTGLLMSLPYGVRFLFFGTMLEVSAEPAPPGMWPVLNLPEVGTPKAGSADELWQSHMTYLDPRVAALIGEWMETRLARHGMGAMWSGLRMFSHAGLWPGD
jgi:hypothetical protein